MIAINNLDNLIELIKQAIKVDNKIYQSKRAKIGLGRLLQLYKPQRQI